MPSLCYIYTWNQLILKTNLGGSSSVGYDKTEHRSVKWLFWHSKGSKWQRNDTDSYSVDPEPMP